MDHFYPKGSRMVERRAPGKGIASFVIAGLGGAHADNEYLRQNVEQINAAGQTPTQALANLHRTRQYREWIVELLRPAVQAGGNHGESIRLFHIYITRWLAANGLQPSTKPPAAGGAGGAAGGQ
jgi:hypothetical protein